MNFDRRGHRVGMHATICTIQLGQSIDRKSRQIISLVDLQGFRLWILLKKCVQRFCILRQVLTPTLFYLTLNPKLTYAYSWNTSNLWDSFGWVFLSRRFTCIGSDWGVLLLFLHLERSALEGCLLRRLLLRRGLLDLLCRWRFHLIRARGWHCRQKVSGPFKNHRL